MQDIDSDVVSNQRKRRKRIGRIKNGIVLIIAGWILLSMILIICLFAKMVSMEKKIDALTVSGAVSVESTDGGKTSMADTETGEDTQQPAESETTWERVTPPATGIDEADNLAAEGDIHKVYLTFDDGPSENTEAILDVLAAYNVKATFFVSGSEEEEAAEIYRRITEEGHTLGMHSYSNKYSVIYQSDEAFAEDYHKLQDYLESVTGVKSSLYRFPGGSSNSISNVPMENFIHFLNKEGTTYYDWNVSAGDAASSAYSVQEIVENVTGDVVKYKTSVVLLHDGEDKQTTVEAIGPLIEALQAMGAQILPIDQDTQVIQSVKAADVE